MSGPQSLSFTLSGRSFDLTADAVRKHLSRHRPGPIQQHWVEIDGMRWPVKQVVSIARP